MTSLFHLQLVSVLRETNHLQQLEREDIPESAQKLFERNDQLTLYVNNLNLIVQWYNKVHRMALDVEKPLIKDELAEIDKVLTKAENNLNWNSPGKVHDHLPPALNLLTSSLYTPVFFLHTEAWAYIEETREKVRDFEQRTQKCKDNVTEIQRIMATWKSLPLHERKIEKHEALLDLEGRKAKIEKR